ncbi:MAG TPA: cbb3-type cytochrome c oxidase subunit I [Myxococcales bacterium]|nr:cbb3-type cytochrome c oxidase subunit I [Myxococcales bacterium]
MIQKNLRAVIVLELLFPLTLLLFGAYHGVLQVLYRAGLIQDTSFLGIGYYTGLTAHGVINAIVLTTFFGVAFGHAVISQQLEQSVSAPAAKAGAALMILGTLVAAGPIFAGKADVLYTFYAPMKAHPLFYIGVVLLVVGSWVSFWGWIPGYLRWRRNHPGRKTPLGAVGIFATFIIWQMCTLPVAYEVIVQLIPYSFGWMPGVNVMLSRLLFWFFGHPLVYFWLLPAYVMYYTVMPKLAGGKLYSDFYGRFAFMAFIVISSPLGLHHQFTEPGYSQGYKALHAVLTFLVAVPSFVTAFTVAASLEHGARNNGGQGLFRWWAKLPHFDAERWLFPYLFMGLVIFIFGGITGIVNASYSMNAVVHNTSWIPAHFHLTVGGPVFLAILGGSLFIVTGVLGKRVAAPRIAAAVPYVWTLGVFTFSTGLFYGGLNGAPRRTNMGLSYTDPTSNAFRADWLLGERIGVVGGCIMGLAVLLFFVVLAWSLATARSAEKADAFALPQAEPLHDEDVPVVRNFRPWVVAGVVAILVSYVPPLIQVLGGNYPLSAG